jgi:hypothetical protein
MGAVVLAMPVLLLAMEVSVCGQMSNTHCLRNLF